MLAWVGALLVVPWLPPVVLTDPPLLAVVIVCEPPETPPRPVVTPVFEVVPLDDVVWLLPLVTV